MLHSSTTLCRSAWAEILSSAMLNCARMGAHQLLQYILGVVILWLATVEAYPELWVSSLEDLVAKAPGQPGCNDHPLFGKRYGRHGAVNPDTCVS